MGSGVNENNNPITDPSLPHQRELLAIITMAYEAHGDSSYLGVAVTDSQEHVRHLLGRLSDSVRWDNIEDTRIHRDGVEVKGGGRVIVMSAHDPGRLMGMNPTNIVLFGRIGELFYWMNSRPIKKIEAVA